MTKTELRLDHMLVCNSVAQADECMAISVKFAISVVEDMKKDIVLGLYKPTLNRYFDDKITELKSLLNATDKDMGK